MISPETAAGDLRHFHALEYLRRPRPSVLFFNLHPTSSFLVALFWISCVSVSSGQITLRGMVVDSASMESLPYVNISVRHTERGTVTDLKGAFQLKAGEEDSIVFSRVGYYTKVMHVTDVRNLVLIFLKEKTSMLQEIEVHDKKPVWLGDLPKESAWRNQTINKSFLETPGFHGIQTFGPGYVFRMPGSGFKKEARAKKRLQDVREENYKAKDYIHLVNGPDIKDRMMKDYALSEEEFYALLAKFNEKNQAFIYNLEGDEVIPLLLQFFADEARK